MVALQSKGKLGFRVGISDSNEALQTMAVVLNITLHSKKVRLQYGKKSHIDGLQIEGPHCHHGADELSGRRSALHQQRREKGQAPGDAQVRLQWNLQGWKPFSFGLIKVNSTYVEHK